MKQKYKEYAELIGMENLTMLSHVFGGSNIYIPKEKELQKREKYKKILDFLTWFLIGMIIILLPIIIWLACNNALLSCWKA